MWGYIAWFVVSLVVSYALQPRVRKNNVDPDAVETQTAEEGIPIPVLFGTRVINTANTVWYGDISTSAIKSKGGKK